MWLAHAAASHPVPRSALRGVRLERMMLLVSAGRGMLLGVELHFVEALAHALGDDAEHVLARLRGQLVQLAGIRDPLFERLLCSLDIFGETLLGIYFDPRDAPAFPCVAVVSVSSGRSDRVELRFDRAEASLDLFEGERVLIGIKRLRSPPYRARKSVLSRACGHRFVLRDRLWLLATSRSRPGRAPSRSETRKVHPRTDLRRFPGPAPSARRRLCGSPPGSGGREVTPLGRDRACARRCVTIACPGVLAQRTKILRQPQAIGRAIQETFGSERR